MLTERVVREDNETGRAVRALQMESFSDADIDEEKILLELMVPQSVSTPKRHPLAPPSTARYSQEHLQQLTPLLHDHSWVDECEVIVIKKTSGLSVREALARAGVCLTAVIMETLKICPFGFHLQSQDQWHSKNQLTARALRHIMPRLGLMDYEHENYKKVYNSIQRFSGTYIFLKHALDHGDFPEQLHELQRKAVQLRFSESNSNPELERCVSMRQCLALQYAPTDLSVTHDEFGENVQPSRNGVITTLDNNTPPPGNDQRGALRLRDVNQIDPIQHAATSVVKGIRQENQQSPLAAYYADAGLKENQTISNIHAN